jgi:hypothetical protein
MSFRRFGGTATLVILGACAGAPRSFVAPTPRETGDAYASALSKVNELGYTVTNTSKEAGFIQATKQTSGFGTKHRAEQHILLIRGSGSVRVNGRLRNIRGCGS